MDAIRTNLLPAILGRPVTNIERDMLALPLRHGGIGIQNPVLIADWEHMASKKITKSLADLIYDQDPDLSKLDMTIVSRIEAEFKVEKEELRKD